MSTRLTAYHGVHPLAPAGDHQKLKWGAPFSVQQYDNVRVRRHTCGMESCSHIYYELCIAGGQGFIRRTSSRLGRTRVVETPPMLSTAAERLWEELLHGRAR